MNTKHAQFAFESSIAFDPNRIRAAAVYCSDGRFGDQCDDLLHNALQLPRYDRLALPGGAACLAGYFITCHEEEAAIEQLRFLVKVHALERVIVIAHQDCAFYSEWLRVPPALLESQQLEDLQKALARIRFHFTSLELNAYFARKQPDGAVRFEQLE